MVQGLTVPKRTNVVVVGGGIIGAMTALELALRGVPVVLCEKGRIAGEQSGRNLGWCRQLGRDARELPLAITAMERWAGLDVRINRETGFRQSGILSLLKNQLEIDEQRDKLADLGDLSKRLGMRLVGAEEISEIVPGSSRSWACGVICETDGRAEPELATAAIAEAAVDAGASVLTKCAVRGFEKSAGKVSTVITELGPIACENVVLACGVWSRHLCGSLGIRLPQLLVMESLLRTGPLKNAGGPCLSTGEIAYRPRLDGGITVAHENATVADIIPASFRYMLKFLPAVKAERSRLNIRLGRMFFEELAMPATWGLDEKSPFEQHRVLAPRPRKGPIDRALSIVKDLWPQFRGTTVEEYWAGFIDVTPDALPVLSPIPNEPGLFLATGFSGHGFGLGPAIGSLVADQVMCKSPETDLSMFTYHRFF